jgi:N-carbamoyl-L-amino-acid hydrolase
MVELRINETRLWDSLMDMGRIGATDKGGVCRLALTDLDRQARDLFISWCLDAGCNVRIDRLGNIFARRPGTDPKRAPVMTGSHLDTQPLGGKFDGIYGVLAGLEVVRTLNENGVQTLAPIDVAVWTDEEGVRYNGAMASKSFAGLCSPEAVLEQVDVEGRIFGEALNEIGYAGDQSVGGFAVDSFFEVHIEQGPILEQEGKTIGVVLGAQAQRCFQVTVTGEEGHAGTLPMTMRRDALLGAARMVDAVNAVAFRYEPAPVITVGFMQIRPNSRNTIPGQVIFTIDSRDPRDDVLTRIGEDMREACEGIASAAGLKVAYEQTSHRKTVTFDSGCVAIVRGAAMAIAAGHRDMYSAAGHDACNLSFSVPTAMVFVPCEKGISHNEAENARPKDLCAGCDVLLQAILARAGVD